MDPKERLSTAFADLRQAIEKRDNARELRAMQQREKETYFNHIKTSFILPTLMKVASQLEENNCQVSVSESPIEITFDLDITAPDALPWRFRLDYDAMEDLVSLTYSDVNMNKRDLCIKANGPMLYDLTEDAVRSEIEDFVISVLDQRIAAIGQEIA